LRSSHGSDIRTVQELGDRDVASNSTRGFSEVHWGTTNPAVIDAAICGANLNFVPFKTAP
jgi:hypothetical protein